MKKMNPFRNFGIIIAWCLVSLSLEEELPCPESNDVSVTQGFNENEEMLPHTFKKYQHSQEIKNVIPPKNITSNSGGRNNGQPLHMELSIHEVDLRNHLKNRSCPRTYDGKICWPETSSLEMVLMPCPPHSKKLSGFVSRKCGLNGKWASQPLDYSQCLTEEEKMMVEAIVSEGVALIDPVSESKTNASEPPAELKLNDPGFFRQIIINEWYKCSYLMETQPQLNTSRRYCPRTFDGWSCWNDTPANSVAYSNCPNFILGFDPNRKGMKVCNPDGTWFRHPDTNLTWSNYTTCVDVQDLEMKKIVNNIFVCGYSISMFALIISLAIFFNLRSLRCTRIRIHKNLFISFFLNNIFWVLWYRLVVDRTAQVIIQNEVGCQLLHILVHYFLVSSYFWMFCEGLYLHTLLVVAFVSEEKIMRCFYVVGWVVPACIVALYGAVRGNSYFDTRHCWIGESHYSWILSVPVCASMLANLGFLVNIVRVLVTKLRASNGPNDATGTKKAVKATLILIPLLGLHYIIIPLRPHEGTSGELAYQIVSAIVSSLQGFFVALLFCFCNTEVLSTLRKRWNNFVFMHERKRQTCSTAYAYSINSPTKQRNTRLVIQEHQNELQEFPLRSDFELRTKKIPKWNSKSPQALLLSEEPACDSSEV